MATEAQKARNARKRAKLKQHRKQAQPWREIVGPGWFILKVSRRESKLWISWTHTVWLVGEGDPWAAAHASWHPAYVRLLDRVLDKLGDHECDPETMRASIVRTWLPVVGAQCWFLSPVRDEFNEDITLDLIQRAKQRV